MTLTFSTLQIASAIKEVVSKAGGDLTPHILCGDFNSEVTSPGYQLCTEGYLSDACIQQLQSLENLQFQDGTVSRIKYSVFFKGDNIFLIHCIWNLVSVESLEFLTVHIFMGPLYTWIYILDKLWNMVHGIIWYSVFVTGDNVF